MQARHVKRCMHGVTVYALRLAVADVGRWEPSLDVAVIHFAPQPALAVTGALAHRDVLSFHKVEVVGTSMYP